MKWIFLILFSVVSYSSMAQQADSLKRVDPKENLKKAPNDAGKESFGDYVQKVGLGFWGKVRERLNLEGVVENLEDKKNKFLGDKNKKAQSDKKSIDTKEKDAKESKPKPDSLL